VGIGIENLLFSYKYRLFLQTEAVPDGAVFLLLR